MDWLNSNWYGGAVILFAFLLIVRRVMKNRSVKGGLVGFLDWRNWDQRTRNVWVNLAHFLTLVSAIGSIHFIISRVQPDFTDAIFRTWWNVLYFYIAVAIGGAFVNFVPNKPLGKKLAAGVIVTAFAGIVCQIPGLQFFSNKKVVNPADVYAGAEVTVNDTGGGVRVISKSNPIENATAGSVPDSTVTTPPRAKPVVSSVVAKSSSPAKSEDLSPLYAGGLPGTIPRNMNEWIEVTAPGNTDATRDPTTGYPTNCSEVISFDDIARRIRGDAWDVKKYRVVFRAAQGSEMFRWIDANDPTNFADMIPGHGSFFPRNANFVKAASLNEKSFVVGLRFVLEDEFKTPLK